MVPDLKQKLKRTFGEFVDPQHAAGASTIKAGLSEVLARISDRGWKSYIVGGTLRDAVLGPAAMLPRDIDVIVAGPSQAVLESTFRDLCVRKTRFGGLHLVKSFDRGAFARVSDHILFDVWRLEDTWGVREQGLLPTIENFVKTPFLNVDSIAIDVFPENGRRKVIECGFFRAMSSRCLDINYEPNPFPLVCIVRSLIMAAKLDFALSPRLASYIAGYKRWGNLDELICAQVSHYGQVRCSEEDLRRWIGEINAQLHIGADSIAIRIDQSRQAALWADWPPISVPTVTINSKETQTV